MRSGRGPAEDRLESPYRAEPPNTWIAQHFVLSPKTVRNHVSNIFAKLRVVDRAQAIVRAREAGMGQSGA